jgi:hypothetical protein
VVNFKWSRARRNIDTTRNEGTAPARAMIPQNRMVREPWAPGMGKGL